VTTLLLTCPRSPCRRAWLLALGDERPTVELLLRHLIRSHRLPESEAVDVVGGLALREGAL
jgi:hypothetical protein